MELRPGYKQSEVGVIPEDWSAETLGPHVSITSGESPSRFRLVGEGVPYFKVDQLNNNSKYLCDTPYFILSNRKVVKGSLIFPKRGASILLNKVRILAQDSFMDTNLMTLTPMASVHQEFLYYAIMHIELWRIADITSIPQINNKHIIPLAIPCPSIKIEQEAIAEALSDADALVESLEQLLTKKRQLKQGAMQELLYPKLGWRTVRLGSLGVFFKGSGVRKDESLSGDIPCIRYGEIYTKHSDYIKAFYSWISPEVAATAGLIKQGDVLFAGSGETREEIGKCVAFVDDIEAYAGGDIVILRPEKVDSVFLGYYLNTAVINCQKAARGQGDAVVHISAAALADIEVALPHVNEQTAIATILSDMDADISALEAKLTKARAIKQGMMQQLLTGNIRLVESGKLRVESGEGV